MSKFLDSIRDKARVKHLSFKTEKSYVDWVERYIRFHRLRHPSEMGIPEVEAFLTSLAKRGVSSSTQNQALSALLFMYGKYWAGICKMSMLCGQNARFTFLRFLPKKK
jgi:hypothetical protein